MSKRRNKKLVPRNEHTLGVGVVARISGCQNQKELSLDDQVDHAKEEVVELYDGEVDYQVVATKGKGERLDRPELAEVEAMIRTGSLDLLVMEDVGRLVRGAAAVEIWGLAVDHGIRCIAPNDCLDTNDESWESDLLAACRDHVGHNEHTSKRIKKKMMLRFERNGGAMALEIAGYIKPEGAKTYDDWIKIESWSDTIKQAAELLLRTLNCAKVARFLNKKKFPLGKYATNKRWDGKMVRRFFDNPLLKGMPQRGKRHSQKHHQTGRRISVPNPDGPSFYECPHLVHLEEDVFDTLKTTIDAAHKNKGRKPVNGFDPRWRVPKSATRFPGQHSLCWYCGYQHVWGANGQKNKLMCSAAREWNCWCSNGFEGARLSKMLVEAIREELMQLDGFESQFAEMVREAGSEVGRDLETRWKVHRVSEASLQREKENIAKSILQCGPRAMLTEQLDELEEKEKELARKRQSLQKAGAQKLILPTDTKQLRQMFDDQFEKLAVDSHEFGDLMGIIAPEIFIYFVRLCDGGELQPRAMVTLKLAAIVPDLLKLSDDGNVLTRKLTLDLFDPPQRERIREEVVRLRATGGLTFRQISNEIAESPTVTAVQKAFALDSKMKTLGIEDPYVLVDEPVGDPNKQHRHTNDQYSFEPLIGYVRPPI